jgi:hypothetical protein
MLFGVFPKNIKEIIFGKRVVINELNVPEFQMTETSSNQPKLSTISPSFRQSMKRMSKINENSSPRFSRTVQSNNLPYQKPELANSSTSNPFFENQFPVRTLYFFFLFLISN